MKLQNEYLESKLEEYENVLSEMEKLQTKIDAYETKLCSPEFLEMSKKENEIIIIRAENSNLKNSIATIEKNYENMQKKFLDYKSEKDKILIKNQEVIQKLSKNLNLYEESSIHDNLTNSQCEKNEKNILNNQISNHNIVNYNDSNNNTINNSCSKIITGKGKEINNTINVLTSRRESGLNNILNLFHSDGKEKHSDRKFSTKEMINLNQNFDSNEILNELISKEISYEKISECSLEEKGKNKNIINMINNNYIDNNSKDSNHKYRACSHIFEKINDNLKIQKNKNIKYKQSSNNNVKNNLCYKLNNYFHLF